MLALLLGVITDYGVLYLSGVRQGLRRGESTTTAVMGASRAYTPIIFTAGAIIALSVATLLLGRLDSFRALGPGLALTVAVTMAVGLTFIPALIAMLGSRAFWPGTVRPGAVAAGPLRRAGARLRRLSTARPAALLLAVVGLAVLGAAAGGLSQTR